MTNPGSSASPRPQLVGRDRLDSWKEIANYLKRGERTVQRWEREQGLPVHRLAHQKMGSVYAYKAELDGWWESRRNLLDRPETGSAASPAEATARPWRMWALGGGVSVLVVAAVLAGWWLASTRRTPAPYHVRPLTAYPGTEMSPSFSPDGSQFAFAWDGEKKDSFNIYVQGVDSGRPVRLTTTAGNEIGPAWSPDGRWIAFVRVSAFGVLDGLYVVPAIGGPERKVAEIMFAHLGRGVDPPMLAWTADSRKLAVGSIYTNGEGTSIQLITVDSGEKKLLVPQPKGPVMDLSPSYSPDGHWLAFTRALGARQAQLWAMPVNSGGSAAGEPRQLTSGREGVMSPVWTADNEIVVSTEGTEERGILRIPPTGKGRGTQLASISDAGYLSISPARSALVYTREFLDDDVWEMRFSHPGTKPLDSRKAAASTRFDGYPDITPDGAKIAFASNRTGNWEIWTADRDGANPVQLTNSGDGKAAHPRWSPDGQHIAYTLIRQGLASICVVRATGGPSHTLTSGGNVDKLPNWSRDGRFIFFSSHRSGVFQLWKMPAAGEAAGAAVMLTRDGGDGLAYESFDGKWVYFSGKLPGVWRVPSSGGKEELVPGLEGYGTLALSRAGMYFLACPEVNRPGTLYFLGWDSRTPVNLASIPRPDGSISASEDGRTVLYTNIERQESDLMLVENFR